jgi:hypothetical protein
MVLLPQSELSNADLIGKPRFVWRRTIDVDRYTGDLMAVPGMR